MEEKYNKKQNKYELYFMFLYILLFIKLVFYIDLIYYQYFVTFYDYRSRKYWFLKMGSLAAELGLPFCRARLKYLKISD